MRVLLRGGQYNGKARFDTWLFTIARNLVIDLSRKRTMASPGRDERYGGRRAVRSRSRSTSPSRSISSSARRTAEVAEVLLKLEPNYREVLVLRFHEELSLEEIASVTRAPLSTVKSRLYRGLAALKPRDRASAGTTPGRPADELRTAARGQNDGLLESGRRYDAGCPRRHGRAVVQPHASRGAADARG